MESILVVGEGERLLSRVRAGRRNARSRRLLENAETVSWDRFPSRVRERVPEGVAVLNLTAPGALPLKDAARLPSDYPGLRVMYILDTEQPMPERLIKQLSRPGVDFVSDRASGVELQNRLQRLMEPLPSLIQRGGRLNRRQQRLEVEPESGAAASLLRDLIPALHNPDSGRLDARRIADWFGMPLKTLARTLNRRYAAIHKTPDTPALQEDLRVYLRIASALEYLAGSYEGAKVWLNAPNPDLENETPRALMEQETWGAEVVAELLEDSLYGQPG